MTLTGTGWTTPIDQPQPGIGIAVTDARGFASRCHGSGRHLRPSGNEQARRWPVLRGRRDSRSAPRSHAGSREQHIPAVQYHGGRDVGGPDGADGRCSWSPSTETPQSEPTSLSRSSNRPEVARFAVGDMIWRDDNRSGVQDPGESPASRISIQLLNADGEVVASTVSSSAGRYVFDNLEAGTYSVRFAGVPEDFRLTPAGAGGLRAADSDPDYSGVTPPFTLGAGEPNVRAATATDVVAAYINPTIDAGITRCATPLVTASGWT